MSTEQKELQELKSTVRDWCAVLRSALKSVPFTAPELQHLHWERVQEATTALEELANAEG